MVCVSPNQKNSVRDKFLSSLDITLFTPQSLIYFLEENLSSPEKYRDCKIDQQVLNWIASKPLEWLQTLYAFLFKHCQRDWDFGDLNKVHFIRVTTGKWGNGISACFQTDGFNNFGVVYHYVDEKVLTIGSKKEQQEAARSFLKNIGVRELNENDEMYSLLKSRYIDNSEFPDEEAYLADLKTMIAFVEKFPNSKEIFKTAKIFKVNAPYFQWAFGSSIYLDEPYEKTGLKHLYELSEDKRWPLDVWYLNCGIPVEKILNFLKILGCQTKFGNFFIQVRCNKNPNWPYLSLAPGDRVGNEINIDFDFLPEIKLLLNSKNIDAVRLIWQALCVQHDGVISSDYYSFPKKNFFQATYQKTDKGGPRTSASQLILALRTMAWVPQIDGSFVKPSDATASQLPIGFDFNSGYKWLEWIQFGLNEKKIFAEEIQRAAEAIQRNLELKKMGFNSNSEEDLELAKEIVNSSPEDKEAIRDLLQKRKKPDSNELPKRPILNPELQKQRADKENLNASDKVAVIKERSVQVGVTEIKTATKVYLQEQYTTNHNKQMICQICKKELPFKLFTGAYYFEAVELVANLEKRNQATYLALCPNHAAAYQYANKQRDSMADIISTSSSTEVDISLGGQETTIYFTQAHLADAKAFLEVNRKID